MKPNPDIKFETMINDIAANLIIKSLRLLIVSANNDPEISVEEVDGARALTNTLEKHRLNAHKDYMKTRTENIDEELIRVTTPTSCKTCDD